MSSIVRSFAGLRAKRNGDNFETLFEARCRMYDVHYERVPNGCKQIAPNRIIRVRTPFDYILAFDGKSAVVDLKSCEARSFGFSKIVPHQLQALKNLSIGMIAGYVVNNLDGVFFVPVQMLLSCNPGSGIDLRQCESLGKEIKFNPSLIFKNF